MKFQTREDIECPMAHVFAQASDFAGFERQAMRRGAEVRKLDRLDRIGKGSAWEVNFKFRGKDRHLKATITAWDPPNGYTVTSVTSGIDVVAQVALVALTRARTRLTVSLDLAPRTLGARLLVQSLRLGRGTLQRRFDLRIADLASEITERFNRQA